MENSFEIKQADKSNYVVIGAGIEVEDVTLINILNPKGWMERVIDDEERVTPDTLVSSKIVQACNFKNVAVVMFPEQKEHEAKFKMIAKAILVQSKAYKVVFLTPSSLEDLKLVKQSIEANKEIFLGFRASIQYSEYQKQDGHIIPLRYLLNYLKGRSPYTTANWEMEKAEVKEVKDKATGEYVTKEEIKRVPVAGLPHIWHNKNIVVIHANDIEAQLDNPEHPSQVEDEYEGITNDGRRIFFKLEPDADNKTLMRLGFSCTQEQMNKWNAIMAASKASHHKTYGTYRKGWLKLPMMDAPYYIYGDNVLAPDNAPEMKAISKNSATATAASGIKKDGSWAEWKKVAALAMKNPCFAVTAGFAVSSPLLSRIQGMEAGIINLVGASGCGKSTNQKGLASFIGSASSPSEPDSYIQSWRVTDNALESPLEARNDQPFIVDELHLLSKKVDVIGLLYMSANGRGKLRMTKEIESRMSKVWKTQIISSGEGSFASRVVEAGHTTLPGGLQFRVIDMHIGNVPFWKHVDDEAKKDNFGAYSWLVNKYKGNSPDKSGMIIEAIDKGFQVNHGHFWDFWIAYLQDNDNFKLVSDIYEKFRTELPIPPNSNSVYKRRSKHIAAAMTGLIGALKVMELDEDEEKEIIKNARAWAIDHLWSAGLTSTTDNENDNYMDTFNTWLASNVSLLQSSNTDTSRIVNMLGWQTDSGSVALMISQLKERMVKMQLDAGRMERTLLENGWEKKKERNPNLGRGSNPVWVLKKAEVVAPLSQLDYQEAA